jgi:Ni/Fe-hydrogenase subunit HybB-like protein
MDVSGPMPGIEPQGYYPSAVEIVLSVSSVVATFFLFALAAKLLPILPRDEAPRSEVPRSAAE